MTPYETAAMLREKYRSEEAAPLATNADRPKGLKKPDRQSRYGGTNRERSAGGGWLNWHMTRHRVDGDNPAQYKRRVSRRRVL